MGQISAYERMGNGGGMDCFVVAVIIIIMVETNGIISGEIRERER